MIILSLRRAALAAAAAAAIGCLIASPPAFADVTKEACLDAHGRGQDAREQGKLTLARKLFLTCAQPSCPGLVQGDCARFADDLGRLQPSLSFVARDDRGHDLPDTSVYVDGVLVAKRLDDGKPHDVDPGKHTVKFSHAGQEQLVTVVVGTGEKGRTVSATFGDPAGAPVAGIAGDVRRSVRGPAPAPRPVRPAGARLLLGLGAAATVGGSALGLLGLLRMPESCSLGTHQCAAPPGDPAFGDAAGAVSLMNVGFVTAGIGVAAFAGGRVWYVKGAKPPRERNLVSPWLSPGAAGIAISGSL